MFLLFLMASCYTLTVDYQVGKCMQHSWFYDGIYKVKKREKLKVFMKNLSGGDDITVSAMDKGWEMVRCPTSFRNNA